MKISSVKAAAYAIAVFGAASFAGVAHATTTTFDADDSGYITKTAGLTERSTGKGVNLVDNSTTQNWDFDVFEFGATAFSGTASSLSLTLYNFNAANSLTPGTYAFGGATGSNTGTLDLYLVSPTTNLEATPATTYGTDTEDGFKAPNVLPAFGNGDFGEGVSASFPGTFIPLFQYAVQPGDLSGSTLTVTDSSLSAAAQSYLADAGTNGIELILADDSTDGALTPATQTTPGPQDAAFGVADTFVGANPSGADNAFVTVATASPAPETSSVVPMAAVFGVLALMAFAGMKRREA